MKYLIPLITAFFSVTFLSAQAYLPLGILSPSGFANYWEDGAKEGNVSFTTDWEEISGIARGSANTNPDYLWMQSDGSIDKLLAVRTSAHASGFDGAMGEFTLSGVNGTDYEDLTSGIGADDEYYIWLADTGDNGNARATTTLLRILEPAIDGSNHTIDAGQIESITMAFPGGDTPSHKDMECAMYDPQTSKVFFITKRITPAKIYSLPWQSSYVGTQALTSEGEVWNGLTFGNNFDGSTNGGYVVGCDISPDGTKILLKSPTTTWFFSRGEGLNVPTALATPGVQVPGYVRGGQPSSTWVNEPQGEAIAWDRAGVNFYTMSEAGTISITGASANNFPLRRYDALSGPYTEVSFQEGISSYTGTSDTYIMVSQAATTHDEATFVVDRDYTGAAITDQRYGLLKFDLSSIPSTATIIGADLDLNISTEGQDFAIYGCYVAWTEASTHNSVNGGAGIPQNDVASSSTAVATHGNPLSSAANHGYNLTTGHIISKSNPEMLALVQSWVSGTRTNNGFVMINIGDLATDKGDGFQFSSSEAVTSSLRPKLTIRYF